VHALNVVTVEGNGVVNISRLQEWKNVVKVFRLALVHSFAMVETPQPACGSSEIIAEVNALFRAVVMSSVSHMWMLARKVPCHIGTKHVTIIGA
jgi:hypothetical protein